MSEQFHQLLDTMVQWTPITCEIRPALRINPRTEKPEMPHCADCDQETPYLFHAGDFLSYRKCPKCMTPNERKAVRKLYLKK